MSHDTRPSLRDTDSLGRENNANLWKLRYHYGEVYHISITFPRDWRAVRVGEPQTVLEAASAADLRELMRADHEARPLPRRPEAP